MDLTLQHAKNLVAAQVQEEHLLIHAAAVSAAMGAMADYFSADRELFEAVGYLHDIDYEKWPNEHLAHTEDLLYAADISGEVVRCVLSHGYGIVNEVEPITQMEKALYTVDELTGIVQAAARMRPNGISDLAISSFMKKFKDKKFAAGCNRDVISAGCEMLGLPVEEVAYLVIEGMKNHADELHLLPKSN